MYLHNTAAVESPHWHLSRFYPSMANITRTYPILAPYSIHISSSFSVSPPSLPFSLLPLWFHLHLSPPVPQIDLQYWTDIVKCKSSEEAMNLIEAINSMITTLVSKSSSSTSLDVIAAVIPEDLDPRLRKLIGNVRDQSSSIRTLSPLISLSHTHSLSPLNEYMYIVLLIGHGLPAPPVEGSISSTEYSPLRTSRCKLES